MFYSLSYFQIFIVLLTLVTIFSIFCLISIKNLYQHKDKIILFMIISNFMILILGVYYSFYHILFLPVFSLIILLFAYFHLKTIEHVEENDSDPFYLYDQLTQLPNRTFLNQYTENMFKDATKQKNFAFLYINIDRFKLVNNIFGYHHADILLRLIAKRLSAMMKKNMMLFRISGDELLMILENSSLHEAEFWANVILSELKQPFEVLEKQIYITSSIGVAMYPLHGKSFQDLLINADTAMSQAKKQGRNTYHVFTPSLAEKEDNLNLINELYTIHKKNQLCLHYQPKFKLPNLNISGVEALLRWKHPKEGLLYPKDFIELAEKTGQIIPMTYWVLEESCRQIQKWKKAGLHHLLPVSINISGLVFEQDNLIFYTKKFIEQYQITPGDLMFEITESTAVENLNKSQKTCQILHQLGIKISVDDFGVGYSNFLYLKDLKIDELKIDRLFLYDVTDSKRGQVILSHMIRLGHQLNLIVTVEGVETQEQLNLLNHFNCCIAQGFFLARPMPAYVLESQAHAHQVQFS